jgi:hypothetical protein
MSRLRAYQLYRGLYWEAQLEGLSAGGTIRLWRYSTEGNRPNFPLPHTHSHSQALDLTEAHIAGVHLRPRRRAPHRHVPIVARSRGSVGVAWYLASHPAHIHPMAI